MAALASREGMMHELKVAVTILVAVGLGFVVIHRYSFAPRKAR